MTNNKIEDISLLVEIGELEFLFIRENPIRDYAPLKEMKIDYFDITLE